LARSERLLLAGWGRVYLALSAVYFFLSAYAAWQPFALIVGRLGVVSQPLISLAASVLSALATLLGYPFVAMVIVACGVAVSGNVSLPALLLLGGSLLYTFSSLPRGWRVSFGLVAASIAYYAPIALLSIAAAGFTGGLLYALGHSPPGLGPLTGLWARFSSTLAGRLVVIAASVSIMAVASNRLARMLMMLLASPTTFLEITGREAVGALLRALAARDWYHSLLYGKLSYMAAMPLAIASAVLAASIAYDAASFLVQATGGERVMVSAAVSAAAGWTGYALMGQLVEALLRGRRWRQLGLASLLLFVLASAYVAWARGVDVLVVTMRSITVGEEAPSILDPATAGRIEAYMASRINAVVQGIRAAVNLLWG